MKESDNYRTDKWILKMFEHWFDPCPYRSVEIDGLTIDWEPKTFCNPPYSNPLPWVEKAIDEMQKGNTVVLLLKNDSSTKWYRKLHEHGAHFMMIQGRLKYQTGTHAPFASVLAVLE